MGIDRIKQNLYSENKLKKAAPRSQKGFAHILILVAAIGLVTFLLISGTASFKDGLFGSLFPKQISLAANPGIIFVDNNNSQITQTTSPTVKAQLVAPWPVQTAVANSNGTVAGVTSATFQINAGADDVNEDGTNFVPNSSAIFLGNGQSSNSWTGFRFTGVSIPKGATITSAKLQVKSSQNQWIGNSFTLAADKSANSTSFSTTSKPSQRTLTLAKVNHSSNSKWVANTDYSLDEMKVIVQEVVDQPTWNSGNALSIILKGTGSAYARKFISSGNPTNSAKLIVTYDTGAPIPSMAPSIVPTPSQSPPLVVTTMATLSEDPNFATNITHVMPFTASPTYADYTFTNTSPGTKTLYVKYTSSTGGEQGYNASIQLVAPAVPSPSATPVSTPGTTSSDIYGGPLADPAMLGTCSQAVHDKYVVTGPDGQLYRTWHPQKDPSGCVFAHEHGEDPTKSLANNTLPSFGYIGKAVNDLEAHPGFKVSYVNQGEKNDEGSSARYSTRIVFHMGTGGVKRYVMSMHSLQFDLVGQGRTVHAMGMADTGGIGSICADPRQGRTVMQLDCLPDSPYEIWAAHLDIAGKVGVDISMAQFDPITTRDPNDNTKLIYTTDTPSKFGGTWPDMHGCDREVYHSPVNFNTPKDGSLETIYTDAMGNPVAAGTGFKQVFSHSSGEIFGSGLIMTYKSDNPAEPMTQMKMHRSQCAPGLGLLN